ASPATPYAAGQPKRYANHTKIYREVKRRTTESARGPSSPEAVSAAIFRRPITMARRPVRRSYTPQKPYSPLCLRACAQILVPPMAEDTAQQLGRAVVERREQLRRTRRQVALMGGPTEAPLLRVARGEAGRISANPLHTTAAERASEPGSA